MASTEQAPESMEQHSRRAWSKFQEGNKLQIVTM
jgi:hypothetical protein